MGVLAVLLFTTVAPVHGAATASGPDYDVPGGHFYTQANGDGSANGYAIVDDAGGPFWTWFKRYGGVAVIGYPNTNRFLLDGYLVQGTQRAVLQWHPESQTMAFMNVLDYLHTHGLDSVGDATYQIPPQVDNASAEAGFTFDQSRAVRESWLDANPTLKKYYLSDPYRIDHFGLPTSRLVDYGPFVAVRMQRAAFQVWKADGPSGIKAGQITQVLASDVAKKVNLFPKAAVDPAPSSGPPPIVNVPSVDIPAVATGYQYGFTVDMQGGRELQLVNLTKDAGFTWMKQQVRWKDIQPTPDGPLNWGEADAGADAASAWGVKMMFSVLDAPAWAAVPSGHFPRNPQDLAKFMAAMAAHFKGRVQAYEIWNEENYATEVGPGNINAGSYVELLKAVYPAIKTFDPNAIVVSGPPTPNGLMDPNVAIDDLFFLQQMFQYQDGIVRNYYDALGAHPEGYGNAPEQTVATHDMPSFSNHPSFFVRRVEDYRKLMVAQGQGAKPIWLTDIGYASNPAPPAGYEYESYLTEAMQADYLTREIWYIRANWPWVALMFIWNLNFQAEVPQNDEKWGFGVLRPTYDPRPAYLALKALPK